MNDLMNILVTGPLRTCLSIKANILKGIDSHVQRYVESIAAFTILSSQPGCDLNEAPFFTS